MSLLSDKVIEPDLIVRKNLGDDRCSSSLRILNSLLYNLKFSCAEPVQYQDNILLQSRCAIIDQSSLRQSIPKEQDWHPVNSAENDVDSADNNLATCDQDVTKFNKSLEYAMIELFGVNYRTKIHNNDPQNFSESNRNHAHWCSLVSLFSGRLTKRYNDSSTLTNKY